MADPANNTGAPAPAAPPTTPTQTTPPAPSAPQVDIAQLMAAIDKRTARAENNVAKSFADQYGMTEDEVTALLTAEKTKRSAQLPPEAQAQVDAANKLVIGAEIKALGTAMGLVDADAAMQLMDMSKVKLVGGKVTGAQEALDALKTAKPYLFGGSVQNTAPQAWGQRQGTVPPATDGVTEAFFKMNPELKG